MVHMVMGQVYYEQEEKNTFSSNISAFGLGTMIYNGMELGSFFEIPWNSPCYQVLRGINPILQMIFTFSQMYFVFMNARVSTERMASNFFIYSLLIVTTITLT